tara:strand:+ start:71 stop:691 length:621 start_codon:yes stop_codon:yes gene_type:complete
MGICKEKFVNKFIQRMESVLLLPPLKPNGEAYEESEKQGTRNELYHNIFMSWMSPDQKKEYLKELMMTQDMMDDTYNDYIRLQDAVIEGNVKKMQSIMDKDIYNRKNPPHGNYKNILMALAIKYRKIDSVEFLEKNLLYAGSLEFNKLIGELANPIFFDKLIEKGYLNHELAIFNLNINKIKEWTNGHWHSILSNDSLREHLENNY